jgi:hypothetical protein
VSSSIRVVDKNFREISGDKIKVCEKTAGPRRGNFSDLNSACSKALFPLKIFQIQDMLIENRFLATFRDRSTRPISLKDEMLKIIFQLNNCTGFS